MHDVTRESVAAVTNHFADALVQNQVKYAGIAITYVCFIALTLAGLTHEKTCVILILVYRCSVNVKTSITTLRT